eukprot:scaffold46557_cov70-Phaeocystis_antarctica.AAC.3
MTRRRGGARELVGELLELGLAQNAQLDRLGEQLVEHREQPHGLGVVAARLRAAQAHSIACPAERIQTLLEARALLDTERPPRRPRSACPRRGQPPLTRGEQWAVCRGVHLRHVRPAREQQLDAARDGQPRHEWEGPLLVGGGLVDTCPRVQQRHHRLKGEARLKRAGCDERRAPADGDAAHRVARPPGG